MPSTVVKPRILTIDALRGLALFGIFYSHMIFWFSGGPLPQEYYQLHTGVATIFATVVYFVLFNAKFFSIFAFLFGLSFHLQIQNLAQRSHHPAMRFAWRLALLGAIGAIHHLFWRADILSVYAFLGFLLIPGRYLSNRNLAVVGGLLVFNIPTKCIELIFIVWQNKWPLIDPMYAQDSQAYLFAVTQADFSQMVQHNFNAISAKCIYLINSGRLCMTAGFFLLGMLAGRLQWFEKIAEHKCGFIYLCKTGAWLILGALIVGAVVAGIIFATHTKIEGNNWVMWAGGLLFDVLSTALTVIYISGFVLLMNRPRTYAVLAPLGSIGKMALSTYLIQSLCGVLLFFNIGAGFFSLTSPWQNSLLAIAIFGLLLFICRAWLRYFRYGPIEWLWRCASDLKWRPIR